MSKTPEQIEEEMIEAAIANVGNFGTPLDMFHPDYGQILKDGQPTEKGLEFFQDHLEQFEINSKVVGKA